jgi:hypothetical protein
MCDRSIYSALIDATAVGKVDASSVEEVKKHPLITCTCIQDQVVRLESINPFKFEFSFMSMQVI